MKLFRLRKTQILPITIEDCWEFFSDPKNLKTLTPKYMGFKVIDYDETSIYSGQIIKYKITPFLGIKMDWVTEISNVQEKSFFIDEQRFGPYKFWHHKHKFKKISKGVEVIDIVDYALPLGPIGVFFQPILIKPKLEEIFCFREKKLFEIFGKI